MRSTVLRIFSIALAGACLAGTAITPAPAVAGGWHHRHHGHFGFRHHGFRHHGFHHHGHSSFVLGLNFLLPLYRPYYYDPPPRVVYLEPPPICRRFHGGATIDATGGRFYGTACLRSDGRWYIVN